jgi:hypothetical protein
MNRVIILAWLGCAAVARAEQPPLPSLPAPTPVDAVATSPAPPPPAPSARPGPSRARKKLPPPKIRLGKKQETQDPHWLGAGEIPKGEIVAKVEGNELMTYVSGEVFSHCFLCTHSLSLVTIELVQEFEIVPSDPQDPRVAVMLGSRIDGYLRSEQTGTACLRQADGVVYAVDGGSVLGVGFPPISVSGTTSRHCEGETQTPSLILPAGSYVIVVRLVLQTTADGLFRSHAESVFSPGSHDGTWVSRDNPPPGQEVGIAPLITSSSRGGAWVSKTNPPPKVESQNFGFAVSLVVDAPPPAD